MRGLRDALVHARVEGDSDDNADAWLIFESPAGHGDDCEQRLFAQTAAFDLVVTYNKGDGDSRFGMDAGALDHSSTARLWSTAAAGEPSHTVYVDGCPGVENGAMMHAPHNGIFSLAACTKYWSTNRACFMVQYKCEKNRPVRAPVSHPAHDACVMAYLAEMLHADHSYDTKGWNPSTGKKAGASNTKAWADAKWPAI
jgi:hypothetical protein